MHRLTVLPAMLACVVALRSHAASVPLIDMDPGADYSISFDEPHINGTWGWTFYVHSPLLVTHVAWYDQGGDGLSHPHRIGLWQDLSGATAWPFISPAQSQQLLPTLDPVVVPAGNEAELIDGWWRRVELPQGPIVLSPGGYALGGVDNPSSTDAIRYHLDSQATGGTGNSLPADSRIRIGAPGYSQAPGFHVPDLFILVSGVELGAMLFVQSIPEPSTMTLTIVGVLAADIIRGRRRFLNRRRGSNGRIILG